jgi:H+/gluconate symporter-like permease
MSLGPRILFIGVAAVLFVLAVLIEENYADLLALGLAALAVGLIVDELGIGRFAARRR